MSDKDWDEEVYSHDLEEEMEDYESDSDDTDIDDAIERSTVKKGYAPGKNPNSHKRKQSFQTQDYQNAYGSNKTKRSLDPHHSGWSVGSSKVASRYSDRSDAASARGDLKSAHQQIAFARQTKDPEKKRLAVQGARTAVRNARNSKYTGIGKADRGMGGYAPGKHPNSHKRGSRAANAPVFAARAKEIINEARAAKAKGDIKRARELAYHAREHARASKNERHGPLTTDELRRPVGENVMREMRNSRRWAEKAKTAKTPTKAEEYSNRSKKALSYASRSASGMRGVVMNNRISRDNSPFTMVKSEPGIVDLYVPITKFDKKEQIVYGWASVSSELGEEITDKQGDVIDMAEIRAAAHDFMLNKRVGGSMHKTFDAGSVVESICLDRDVQKSLGIDLGMEGWYIGVKVTNANDWARVESGEFTGFSIGGSGIREKMDKGYAPGKNPNSHIKRARKALQEGDKGKASYHAFHARRELRAARGSNDRGLKSGPGMGAHVASLDLKQDKTRAMGLARKAKKPGTKSKYVAEARKTNRLGRKAAGASRSGSNAPYSDFLKSEPGPSAVHVSGNHPKSCKCDDCKRKPTMKMFDEVVKGYAPGKNPNSHKRKGSAPGTPTEFKGKSGSHKAEYTGRKVPMPGFGNVHEVKLTEGPNAGKMRYITNSGDPKIAARKGRNAAVVRRSSDPSKIQRYLQESKRSMAMARKAKERGDKTNVKGHVRTARMYTGMARLGKQFVEEADAILKGYAPGKNPNSHKSRMANRGGKGTSAKEFNEKTGVSSWGSNAKAIASRGLTRSKEHLKAARKALDAGDKGKAAYHANAARDEHHQARKIGTHGPRYWADRPDSQSGGVTSRNPTSTQGKRAAKYRDSQNYDVATGKDLVGRARNAASKARTSGKASDKSQATKLRNQARAHVLGTRSDRQAARLGKAFVEEADAILKGYAPGRLTVKPNRL